MSGTEVCIELHRRLTIWDDLEISHGIANATALKLLGNGHVDTALCSQTSQMEFSEVFTPSFIR